MTYILPPDQMRSPWDRGTPSQIDSTLARSVPVSVFHSRFPKSLQRYQHAPIRWNPPVPKVCRLLFVLFSWSIVKANR